jgi:hypothetical protein
MCLSNTQTAILLITVAVVCAIIYRYLYPVKHEGFAGNCSLITAEPIEYKYRDYPYLPRKYLWHLPEHTWTNKPRFDYAFGYDISGKLIPIPPNFP